MTAPAIETRDLVKEFTKKTATGLRAYLPGAPTETRTAVDGVTLDVAEGELFGLLGPNGAGKTTLVKLLATLLLPTTGTARVGGLDVETDSDAVRRKVGVVLGGERALYWRLTARENLWYFSQLYDMPARDARARIDELLNLVGLTDRADDRVEDYSKGMKQRLHVARGLLNDPDILLLDEPSIGLDPHAARMLRGLVNDVVRKHGKTVVLTTHYMQEADELSDRVAIMNHGRVIACDAPGALKASLGDADVYRLTVRDAVARREGTTGDGGRTTGGGALADALAKARGVARVVGSDVDPAAGTTTYRLIADADAEDRLAGDLADLVSASRARLVGLSVDEPTLEDAFVRLTGEELTASGGQVA